MLEKYSGESEKVNKDIRRFGMFRISFFLLWVVFIYLSTNWSWSIFGLVIAAGLIIFSYLISAHSRLHKRRAVLEQLIRINREECDAMEWKYSGLDPGTEYMDEHHLYSYDLDIFGEGSLFQYINRTSTRPGKDRLAAMLTTIERSGTEINSRQDAIQELSELFDWRQDFRAQGLLTTENPDDISGLREWVDSPRDFGAGIFRFLIVAVPLLNLAMFMLVVLNVISFWTFLAYLIVPLILGGIKHRKVNLKHHLLSRKVQVLKKYSGLFRRIEDIDFKSDRMADLRANLMTGGIAASHAVRRLAGIATAFDTRLNLLAGFLMNVFFLWDIRQSVRLENWQKKYRKHLPHWFDVMAETDAFISLAGYAYNNPGYAYAEIREAEDFFFKAKDLGHPLIPHTKRVDNNFRVDGWKNFTILTGANMAGKSTFLRTVGVNMLLGSCGAPVCASSLSFTPVQLITSIHTIDSLANNESYFYAELKRLKMIIDMLKDGRKLFIILDEILKGTNSNDKQSGSRALVKQLISLQASGIIATHDLKLGELEEQFPENVRNRCFEIIIEKDRLEYDYTLKKGIARNMNATILMERMGITLNHS